MCIRSHSQMSITFVTLYGFLGNRLRTDLCNEYESYFKSHGSTRLLDFVFVAAASFRNVENAPRLVGIIHNSSGHHGTVCSVAVVSSIAAMQRCLVYGNSSEITFECLDRSEICMSLPGSYPTK